MKRLSVERQGLYGMLGARIGMTPLVSYKGNVSNGNAIWMKLECNNPFGSHYDRAYLELFRHYEMAGAIHPSSSVLETTSGSAGVSFAGIGRLLGYKCHVMIPEGELLRKRREAIEREGASLILTPAEEYILGFTPERILESVRKYSAKFLNHSSGHRGRCNEITLHAFESIANEVLEGQEIDYYICGMGNGSSILGPGRVFKQHNPAMRIVSYKPLECGASESLGLLNQDTLERRMRFPHLLAAEALIDETMVFSSKAMEKKFGQTTHPHYDTVSNADEFGVSTRAGIAVALEISKSVSNKSMLVLAYDKANRYVMKV